VKEGEELEEERNKNKFISLVGHFTLPPTQRADEYPTQTNL
jgi:hypothetical protein